MTGPIVFNGIDGASGDYLLPPLEPEQFASLIRDQARDSTEAEELSRWHARLTQGELVVKEGVDPQDLAQAGWGIIFPRGCDPAIIAAFQPLIAHRRAQAAAGQEHLFKLYAGDDGYLPGESKNSWLARHGSGPGAVDPNRVPYYLLLAGDPRAIPYHFQSQLDVQ